MHTSAVEGAVSPLLTVHNRLALLEERDRVAVGHARLHRHGQGLGLAHQLHVGAVLADLRRGAAQREWGGGAGGGTVAAWPSKRHGGVTGERTRQRSKLFQAGTQALQAALHTLAVLPPSPTHCTASVLSPTCVVYCWYMPGPTCCVTTLGRHLHLRVPAAGLITFLSRTICNLAGGRVRCVNWPCCEACFGAQWQAGVAEAEAGSAGHQAGGAGGSPAQASSLEQRARLEVAPQVQVFQRHFQLHPQAVPLGRLLLLRSSRDSSSSRPAGFSSCSRGQGRWQGGSLEAPPQTARQAPGAPAAQSQSHRQS